MNKKVLVTGGSGFIGSHIVDILLKNDYKVVVVNNVTFKEFPSSHAHAMQYHIDLKSADDVDNCIRIERPDVICHHAASISYVKESILYPQKSLHGFQFMVNLMEAAKKYDIKHVIFASSSSVYSTKVKPPYTEDSLMEPMSPLAITKFAIEHYCRYLEQTTGIKFTIFRYFNAYGPRQRLSQNAGIIPNLIEKGLRGEKITIFGDGLQTRDFIYVKDIAYANLLAVQKEVYGTYNVGSGKAVSIKETLGTIEAILRKKISVVYERQYQETLDSVADTHKIRKALGWKPTVSLSSGLGDTIRYYKEFYP